MSRPDYILCDAPGCGAIAEVEAVDHPEGIDYRDWAAFRTLDRVATRRLCIGHLRDLGGIDDWAELRWLPTGDPFRVPAVTGGAS